MAAVTVLHLSPHPDDEAIAAPATLLALREAGHRVVNVVCSLGRPGQAERRRREAADAAARAGLALEFLDPPLRISRGDDLRAARSRLGAWVSAYVAEHGVELVVSPSPHDGHHGHEVVGRAVRDGIERGERNPRWWVWGLWADLPLPTLMVEFDQQRLDAVLQVLAAHPGELERNDYAALVRCRATANYVLGAERVFGFGSPGLDGPYAELLTELGVHDRRWTAYEPRRLDAASPLLGRPGERTLTWWLDEPSFRDRLDAQPSEPEAGPAGGSLPLR